MPPGALGGPVATQIPGIWQPLQNDRFSRGNGAAHFANPNSSAEGYLLHCMQQNYRLQSYWERGGQKKSEKKKLSEWGWPGVENVAPSLESLFIPSRAPQRLYIAKSKNLEN